MQWMRNVGNYRVVVVSLPVPPGVLENLFAISHQTPKAPTLIVHDPNQLFDETLVRPATVFQYVASNCADELAEQIQASVLQAEEARQGTKANELLREWLIGESRPMQELRAMVRLVAPRNSTVLISGETGTGKERVARAIHAASLRSTAEMVAVNCGALPETLIEAELFGHTKGAFTGATGTRSGRFEQAHKATLFLDEVVEIPLPLQTRLLRVLQERELQRVGSSETIKIDTRIIAASNCDLAQRVAEKRFREDLYYRLNVARIHVPPLRDRASDIPELVEYFVEQVCRREELPAKTFSADAMRRLTDYEWPGNVRQLEHAVEMAVTLSGNRRSLFLGDIDFPDLAMPLPEMELSAPGEPSLEMPRGGIRFEEVVGRVEKLLLEQALRNAGGNKAKAADSLGIKRTTLLYKMKALEGQVCAG